MNQSIARRFKPSQTLALLATAAVIVPGPAVRAADAGSSPAPQPAYATALPKPAAPDNPLSLFEGKLVFDVQERARVEGRDNNFDFNNNLNAATDDLFVLSRFRLGMLARPLDFITLYGQGQDARELGARRKSVPFVLGAEGDDPFDLRQGWVEFGNLKKFPLSLRAGRQELLYGDERLVGNFEWNNFARTFDAAKLHYENPDARLWVDGFVGHVVTIEGRGTGENVGFITNDANWNDTLAGFYLSTTLLPVQTTDVYLFYRQKPSNDPVYTDSIGSPAARAYDIAQEIFTMGFRVKSTPGKLNGFDYEAEGTYQVGRSAGQFVAAFPGPQMLEHNAFAGHVGAGYTWEKWDWKPRLSVEYNIASGDSDPNDNTDQSFLNLFPTNHKFYGYMDFFAWKNVHNPALSLKLTPYQDPKAAWRAFTVQLDGHAFWLYTNEDAWYRANAVTRVRPLNAAARSADPFVGEEIDLTLAYSPWKFLKLQAGFSHFFAVDYVRQTAAGANGDSDANFGYLQATVSF
ncbi:MAG: alginate export family protein [Verrucomicrobia bacterium]|nr:alginate export family protein [Verrucomicrobiota bacterium]